MAEASEGAPVSRAVDSSVEFPRLAASPLDVSWVGWRAWAKADSVPSSSPNGASAALSPAVPAAPAVSAIGDRDVAGGLAEPAGERSRPPRLPRPSRRPRSREPRLELRLPEASRDEGEGPKAEVGIGEFGSAMDSRANSAASAAIVADGLMAVATLFSAAFSLETLSSAAAVGAVESFSVVGSGAVAASGSDSGSGSGVARPNCEARLNQWRRRGAGLAAAAGFVFAFGAGLGGASAEMTSTGPLGAAASDSAVVFSAVALLTASSSPAFGVWDAAAAGGATGPAAAMRPVDESAVAWGAS